jgi:hypothetical protein
MATVRRAVMAAGHETSSSVEDTKPPRGRCCWIVKIDADLERDTHYVIILSDIHIQRGIGGVSAVANNSDPLIGSRGRAAVFIHQFPKLSGPQAPESTIGVF